MRLLVSMLTWSLMALGPSLFAAPPARCSIHGSVAWFVGNELKPVSGLRVELRDFLWRKIASTTTGIGGVFDFPNLKPGRYRIRADDEKTMKADSIIPVVAWVRLTEQTPDIQVHMQGPDYPLDGDDGRPDMTTCTQGLTFRMGEIGAIPLR
jgi:hypothetical protein